MKKKIGMTGLFMVLFSGMISKTDAQTFGLFEHGTDIGNVKNHGTCIYDSDSETYILKGSGTNMWNRSDEFYFIWKHMEGDCIINSCMEWIGNGVAVHRKGGLILRESLEPDSRYVDIAYHGNGLMSMQYRDEKDSATREITCPIQAAPNLQLEKVGDKIYTKIALQGVPLSSAGELNMKFTKGYYVGIFICSHNPDVTEAARFINTRLTIPAKEGFKPYTDYIGCRLEIIDVKTGLRKVIYQSQQPFEAPNWSKDGKFLVFNSKGLIYRIPAEGGKPELINTGFAINNNNDHGISPDGKLLVISNQLVDKPSGENSAIFTLSIDGGIPNQITDKSPSYWHGWSPDGKYLVYTAKRNNQFDIYRIPASGGEEVQLTNSPSHNDGSEYSTDGQYIWFNSSRTGTMQIWRMKADGSEPTQITFDNFQNWFVHQSPDGRQLVFLSYPPEINPADHPYYKHVMLRIMDVDDLNPKVIAYLYGGQGTINVPSWSPDSKKIAFVSNTDGLPQ